MTILLVDDDPTDARLVREILVRQDPEITIIDAQTCDEALWIADTEHIDCIVMDQKLEGLQGSDCVRALRQKDYQGAFILLTGFSDPRTAVAAMKHGADDYLDKRDMWDRLLYAIRDAAGIRGEAVKKQREAIEKNRRLDERIDQLEEAIVELRRERRAL